MPRSVDCAPDCGGPFTGDLGAPEEWARKAMLNVAGMGHFTSDRTVSDYARLVWDAVPVRPSQQ